MKKLINDPRAVVREMLEGLTDLAPGQALLDGEDVVIRAGLPPHEARCEVAVLSGGGSGHEPAHAGYVGAGMLHAAVCGDVFTSPSVDAVLAAIHAVAGPPGVLLIIKNYTGDRLNFGLAAELARAEGIAVETIVVADDVALRDTVEPERRRGIAGTVLVHKIAGAAAASGLPLPEVAREGRGAAAAMGTMGVALGPCTVPAAGRPGFVLGDNEVELGLGIHGELGIERTTLRQADQLVDEILVSVLTDRGLGRGTDVALLVNGLGGTPVMELAIVARRAIALLRQRGLRVARAWSGNFLTALEMPGVSLTVLPVNEGRLHRLDAPTTAPAWPGDGHIASEREIVRRPSVVSALPYVGPPSPAGALMNECVLAAADTVERAEAQLTALDAAMGDGDLGASMARAAGVIRALPDTVWSSPVNTILIFVANALRRAMGGTSGPLYATALLRAAQAIPADPDAMDWAAGLTAAVDAIAELGGAKSGDRTMLDALHPAAAAFASGLAASRSAIEAWRAAVAAAQAGAAATAQMYPRLGRASYLGERAVGTPDAGAVAVAIWMEALWPLPRDPPS
jgi:ATP-dependent dihydroxyacetone kinase